MAEMPKIIKNNPMGNTKKNAGKEMALIMDSEVMIIVNVKKIRVTVVKYQVILLTLFWPFLIKTA